MRLGPQLAKLLGFNHIELSPEHSSNTANNESKSEDNRGDLLQTDVAGFNTLLGKRFEDSDLGTLSADDLLELSQELLAADFPAQLLLMIDKQHEAWARIVAQNPFAGCFTEASAAMRLGEVERALGGFMRAHQAQPDEPAPYTNIAQLYLGTEQAEQARPWIERGINVAPNHPHLWQAWYDAEKALAHEALTEGDYQLFYSTAMQANSWVGLCMWAALTEKRPEEKHRFLHEFYLLGERDPEFLLEYTANLGFQEAYKDIVSTIWEAEEQADTPLPWQLVAHKAQAQLALGEHEAFYETLNRLKQAEGLPEGLVQEWLEMAKQEMRPS